MNQLLPAKLLAKNEVLQKMVSKVQDTVVELSYCVVCSNEYGVGKARLHMSIEMIHIGGNTY